MHPLRTCIAAAIVGTALVAATPVLSQSGPDAQAKFGALAVDRSQGFVFGWAQDHPTRAAASAVALEECAKRNGNCAVVVEFSGQGCASFHTLGARDGSAYGWGTGPTRQVAEASSLKHCNAFADGAGVCGNHVWACNSNTTSAFEVLHEAVVKAQPAKTDCLVRFEVDAETSQGSDWVDRFDTPVYRLSAKDCPTSGPDEYHGFSHSVYQGVVEQQEDNPAGSKNPELHARGIKFAEDFYNWFSDRHPPGRGHRFRTYADVAVTTVTEQNLSDLLTTVGQSDSDRQHGTCLAYLPPGVVPVSTHGAKECREWIR